MYTGVNFQTKKEFRQAVELGRKIGVFQPGPFGSYGANIPDGTVCIEGPHYPQPHKWYAQATIKDGFVVKVK